MTADTKAAALADKLDHHNRWRRGHEEYAMDDPTQLGVTIDAAAALLRTQAARIAELEANGVHSCHPECTRPVCVLQRRVAELEAERAGLLRALRV